MDSIISGKEITEQYGLQPFELVAYCKKGLLKPRNNITGRSIQDPEHHLPYTKEQYEMRDLIVELNIAESIHSDIEILMDKDGQFQFEERMAENRRRLDVLKGNDVKCPPDGCLTRVQQLPEYEKYEWMSFDIPAKIEDAEKHINSFLDYLYSTDEIKILEETEGICRFSEGVAKKSTNLPFLDDNHPFYVEELKISIETWLYMFEEQIPQGFPVLSSWKKQIKARLVEKHPKMKVNCMEHIAYVINPDRTGWAPRTP